MLPLHQRDDQLTPGIRTRPLFFPERLIYIAEKNLTVKNNRMNCCALCARCQVWRQCKESNLNLFAVIILKWRGRTLIAANILWTGYDFFPHNLVESRGVEPHPILHQNPVFKAGRHTNAPALLSIFGPS